jgi:ABC exporter DevB family membrane fusion protein
MTRRRLALTALFAVLLAVAVGLIARQSAAPPPAPATETGKPGASRVVATAPGRVEPASEERDIAAELRGVLRRVHVDEGDRVRAGQILAELAGDEFRARVRQARALVTQREAELARLVAGARPQERREADALVREARAALEQASLDLARRAPLARSGATSGEALDRARNDVAAAEARLAARTERLVLIEAGARVEDLDIARALLELARGQLAEAEAFLDKTVLRSPMDGMVLHRFRREGETVSDQPPTPVVKLGDVSRLRVRVDIDETDIARIAIGQRAYVTADAWPGQRFEGRVLRLGQRLGRKTLRTDDPTERNDSKVLETLIELAPGTVLPVGLRVDAFILAAGG